MKRNWQGKKVIVIGAARQGLAASHYLAGKLANVFLTDSRPFSEIGNIADQFTNLSVELHLGGHPIEILNGADIVCVSGGVPLTIPFIQEAQKRGIPFTNDSQLFMEEVNAKVIGITGSAGKTTTTVLTGEIAKAAVEPKSNVWVGGNIGFPLIEHLDEIKPQDWVVHEFSSFQLEQMTISPHIAVVTNITPNHLDRHKTMEAYTTSKVRILDYQTCQDFAVLNRDDSGSYNLCEKVAGSLLTFGFNKPDGKNQGIFIDKEYFTLYDGHDEKKLMATSTLQLSGRHNIANAMAACTACIAAGFSYEAMRAGINSVKGISHRLELVGECNGVRWINDSIATAPERVMAAMRAIEGPLVMLLGGRDKDLPWDDLASLIHERHPKVVLFGEAGGLVFKALKNYEGNYPSYPIFQVETLDEAVKKAAEIAKKGDSILLSPGGTSYDAYHNFEERGDHFRTLVKAMT
jgi:UDP-N-acetylmuramoylalanine--D-glutamate ligase